MMLPAARLSAPESPEATGVAYDGREFVALNRATVSMLDRGFVRSDATYDVVHVWNGSFFRLDDYVTRFFVSMGALGMGIDESPEQVKDVLHQCVVRSGLRNAYVQMTCTRGVPPKGSRNPRECKNLFTSFAQPFVWIATPEQQETGVHMIVASNERISSKAIDLRIKNFHWLDLTTGIFEAYERGASIAVHPGPDGKLTEGAGFNLFVAKGNTLATPDTNVFEGMTRRTVLEAVGRLQLKTEVRPIDPQELSAADEVFVTSTAGGIIPVTQIDGQDVGSGSPGQLTRAVRDLYWSLHEAPDFATAVNYSSDPEN
ncbi:aminotransferase class IV [Ruegeria sp. 2012CJ41-6]|uniref:Probable branched-chain-amino-acid aminotransferase n=1 Tax=Ruegeria spongiae TaxID=2942209 RepID=A0ABT0Q4R3_9RHOB|nr:aminotransferase class IV [Ruegeria spongiae]MCL6284173.1 aminotransferase class IV [Ruegeria spongiae]